MFFLPPSTTIAEAILFASTVSFVYLRNEYATFFISTSAAESVGGGGVGSVPGMAAVTSAGGRWSSSPGLTNFGCCCRMVQMVPAASRIAAPTPWKTALRILFQRESGGFGGLRTETLVNGSPAF